MNRKSILLSTAIGLIALIVLIGILILLPDSKRSPLDGAYVKVDPSYPQWWLCRRCADYRPAGGIWNMSFEESLMRVEYEVTGWRSQASYSLEGDRLRLFDDPYCPGEVGEYIWHIEDGRLSLTLVEDPCSFGLRGQNLGAQAWHSCLPPGGGVKDGDWQAPTGCQEIDAASEIVPTSDLGVTVSVHAGDSRFFDRPPDLFAQASGAPGSAPEGIQVTFHTDSILYGLQRVLWWDGDWVQASTDLPFASMGVQFFGDPSIGWARVLFDGEEVWRGNTSEIWSKHGRHGGYVEISGFQPGMHVLRAESLGFDYHPVTVVSFGFSYRGILESVQP